MPRKRPHKVPSKQEIEERLRYNHDHGTFRWRFLTADAFPGRKYPVRDAIKHNRQFAGKNAGSVGKDGRVHITLNWYEYRRSDMVMVMCDSYIPGLLVDHKDGDPSNDHRSNLRMATWAQNTINRKNVGRSAYQNRSSGKWFGSINIDGRTKRLGPHFTRGEAMVASAKASIRHHGEYSPFLRKKISRKNSGFVSGL